MKCSMVWLSQPTPLRGLYSPRPCCSLLSPSCVILLCLYSNQLPLVSLMSIYSASKMQFTYCFLYII